MTSYHLIGSHGSDYTSPQPGAFGGNKAHRPPLCGRLDCSWALRTVADGTA